MTKCYHGNHSGNYSIDVKRAIGNQANISYASLFTASVWTKCFHGNHVGYYIIDIKMVVIAMATTLISALHNYGKHLYGQVLPWKPFWPL